jgi:RHS repeat-associated protein
MRSSKPGIYTPLGLNGYERCHPVNKDDFETIAAEINGTPRRSSWRPIPMQPIHEDEGKTLAISDSPWLADDALILPLCNPMGPPRLQTHGAEVVGTQAFCTTRAQCHRKSCSELPARCRSGSSQRMPVRKRQKQPYSTRWRISTAFGPHAHLAAEDERVGAKPQPNETLPVSYGYTGHRFESELRLTDAGGRFYDAKFGIFLSPDPIGPLNGVSTFRNRYPYAGHDPINFVDPTGFRQQWPTDGPGPDCMSAIDANHPVCVGGGGPSP